MYNMSPTTFAMDPDRYVGTLPIARCGSDLQMSTLPVAAENHILYAIAFASSSRIGEHD